MDGKTILPRSEVPEEFTWDLRDVFASDEAWNDELEALKAYPERLSAFAGRLGESAKTLLDWFTLGDEVNVRVTKLVEYASCRSDQDVGNSFYQGMRSKAFSAAVALSSASAFEASEIMALSDKRLRVSTPRSRSLRPIAATSISCAAARRISSRPSARSCLPLPARSARAPAARSACSTTRTSAIPT